MANSKTKPAAEPPRDFESLRSVILQRKDTMPKRLAQVAAFALERPDDIAFGTAASIAAAADVQPSTLVRLAYHFHFDGFSDMQRVFRERLRERTSTYEERLHALEESTFDGAEAAMLKGFLNAASASIAKLAATIDPETFVAAIEVLAKADTIYLVAKRRSYPLTAHMAYAFSKLKIRHCVIDSPNGVDAETIEFATPRDAAICASFSPYAAESLAQTQALFARKVPVIAITDSAFSPLAACATHWFEVAEADFAGFRSLSASVALASALPVAIAERRMKNAGSQSHR